MNLLGNGLTQFEISQLDCEFNRKVYESIDFVDIRIDSGFGAPGGYIIKIKEERYP